MLLVIGYLGAVRFPDAKRTEGLPLKEGIKLLKEPALLLTGFFLFFQSGVEGLFNNWTTSFLKSKMNTPAEDALYALSFMVVGLTAARLIAGFLLKKMSSFVFLLISLIVVGAGSLVMNFASSYETAFVSLIFIGAGLSAGFPVILGYVGQLFPRLSGTAFSIAFVIALTGNAILNYLAGVTAHYFSIDRLPVLAVVCVGCMVIILFFTGKVIGKRIRL
jgi:fucose permease